MEIELTLLGERVKVPEGLTVAAAMFLRQERTMRLTAVDRAPRSWFCGMGVCHECRMEIDGIPNTRACQTVVRPGMNVALQSGEAALEPAP